MSFNTKVYRVFIASPGDVPKEREQLRLAIHQLNEDTSIDAIFIPILYEKLAPRGGHYPQKHINENGLDTCDILISLFWTKLGEGTIEEIKRHLDAGKYAMTYRLNRNNAVPSEIVTDPKKVVDYIALDDYFKRANTRESNELGLYKEVKNGIELSRLVQDNLRQIRPILAEIADEFLDEAGTEADWLSEVEDDNDLANAIPIYKVGVSRQLVLKMADKKRDNNRSQVVWDAILKKFEGRDGNMNLMRTLSGLARRKKFDHPLFEQGLIQLYSNRSWMFLSLMKKLLDIDRVTSSEIIAHADWLEDDKIKERLLQILSLN
jgi:hypothetical protein